MTTATATATERVTAPRYYSRPCDEPLQYYMLSHGCLTDAVVASVALGVAILSLFTGFCCWGCGPVVVVVVVVVGVFVVLIFVGVITVVAIVVICIVVGVIVGVVFVIILLVSSVL